tara:strand:+ start:45 stop:551 length:507 start_codon:yes stop_codon:yes gene_type:complete
MSLPLKIEKDFLPREQFDFMVAKIVDDVPWWIGKIHYDTPENRFKNMQMVHYFYEHHTPNKQTVELIYPILEKVQPCAVIKIKANLVMATDTIVEHGLHRDVEGAEHLNDLKTSILYLNDNDGYTKFEDGTKHQSVANTMVTFPNSLLHTGSTCTNEHCRLVLNLNYI